MPRRHGTLLRSGQGMLLDETTLCATCWMHGVFAAQLTIGNTSFHKLFSVSRDPYNITRASGLRILADLGDGWRLLAVPSAFEMGLSDCRWIYRLGDRTITVDAVASGDDAGDAMARRGRGRACRFLVFGHLVLGERELDHAGRVEIDADAQALHLPARPGLALGPALSATPSIISSPARPMRSRRSAATNCSMPTAAPRGGGYVALRTRPTQALRFAVVGSLTDATEAERLAAQI